MVWAILNDTIMAGVNEFVDHQSERVVAILGGSVAEEALARAMYTRFRVSSMRDEVFKDRGALGAFRSKIEIAYLLGMYEKPARLALVGISEIRNFFAHGLTVRSFDTSDKGLDDSFAKLTLHGLYRKYPSPFWSGDSAHEVETTPDRRSLFIVNLKLLLVLLMRDMAMHQPNSNQFNSLPGLPLRETPPL